MGNFRIVIEAAGGHGCDRTTKEGAALYGACRKFGCPDCETQQFVETLKRQGYPVSRAEFTHWPGEPTEVVDDLVARKRLKGKF